MILQFIVVASGVSSFVYVLFVRDYCYDHFTVSMLAVQPPYKTPQLNAPHNRPQHLQHNENTGHATPSAILSHDCATLSREKVADAAKVWLHAATLSSKKTPLLRQFSRFTILLHEDSSKMAKLFHVQSFLSTSIDRIVRIPFHLIRQPAKTKLL